MIEMIECPYSYCNHPLNDHTENGCEFGWEWDENGVATKTGCRCLLWVGHE